MKNSCYECTERVIGCHGWCPKYAKFREDLEQIKREKQDNVNYGKYYVNAKLRMKGKA